MYLENVNIQKNIFLCVLNEIEDGEKVTVHSNPDKTKAGSRHYIHASDVADALAFF